MLLIHKKYEVVNLQFCVNYDIEFTLTKLQKWNLAD